MEEGQYVELIKGGGKPSDGALVTRMHRDGTVSVELIDSGKELSRLSKSSLKVPSALQPGTKVDVRAEGRSGKWRSGIVAREHDGQLGTYYVVYESGQKEKYVERSRLRKKRKGGGGGGGGGGAKRGDGGRQQRQQSDDGGEEDTRSFHKGSGGALRKGTRVDAKPRGRSHYHAGRIARARDDGSFDVTFDNADKYGTEKSLPASSIRADERNSESDGDSSDEEEERSRREPRSGRGGRHGGGGGDSDDDGYGEPRRGASSAALPRLKQKYGDGSVPHIGSIVEVQTTSGAGAVATRQGTVCWVHRDGKYAIEFPAKKRGGGGGEVFEDVPAAHILKIDGKPASGGVVAGAGAGGVPLACGAQVSDRTAFALRLSLEVVAFGWVLWGLAQEQSFGWELRDVLASAKLRDATFLVAQQNASCLSSPTKAVGVYSTAGYAALGEGVLRSETGWLAALLGASAVLVLLFALLCAATLWRHAANWHSGAIGAASVRGHLWAHQWMARLQIGAIVLSSASILAYGSVLNKFRYFCMWGDHTPLSTQFRFADWAFAAPPLSLRYQSSEVTLAAQTVAVAGHAAFNVMRGVFFFSLMHGATTLRARLAAVAPSVAVAALLVGKLAAVWDVALYVQRLSTDAGTFTSNSDVDAAAVAVVFAMALVVRLLCLVRFGASFEMMEMQHDVRGNDIEMGVMRRARGGDFGVLARREVEMEEAEEQYRASGSLLSLLFASHASHGLGSAFLAGLAWSGVIVNAALHAKVGASKMWDHAFHTDMLLSLFYAVTSSCLYICLGAGIKSRALDRPDKALPSQLPSRAVQSFFFRSATTARV